MLPTVVKDVDMTIARRLVGGLVRRSGTSFYWGMWSLPRLQRSALFAIYAFCRIVDDIADSDCPSDQRLAALDQWRQIIGALYDQGNISSLSLEDNDTIYVVAALAEAISLFALPRNDFEAVIDGVAMDARESMRAPGWDELTLYAQRVAGAVGLLASAVFGDRSAPARRHGLALGMAFQLTNVLRDLAEDAERGRLYLPREYLFEAGIWDTDPLSVLEADGIDVVCRRIAKDARDNFAQAMLILTQCDVRALRPALIMGQTYRHLLTALEQRGWANGAWRQKVRVSGWTKVAPLIFPSRLTG